MNEEEFFNRMINRICKDYGYEVANSFKLMYLKKNKQLEAYENMRLEINSYICNNSQYDENIDDCWVSTNKLIEIIDKVGEDNE